MAKGSKYGQGRVFERHGVWWFAWFHNNREYRASSKTRGPAGRKKALAMLAKQLDESTRRDPSASAEVTLTHVFDLAITEAKENRLADLRSIVRHADTFKRLWGADFRAASVDSQRVRAFRTEKLGEGAAPATVNRYVASLRHALRLGVRDYDIPMRKFPEQLDESDNVRQGFVEPEQITALLNALPADVSDLVEWCYRTGMRIGEAKSLQWKWYSAASGLLSIPAGATKGRKARSFPCVGLAGEIIKRRQLKRNCDFIFSRSSCTNGRGVREFEPQAIGNFRETWASACEKVGLGELHVHDLRRSTARNLKKGGVSDDAVMKTLGHKTRSMLTRYNIVDEESMREAIEQGDRYVEARRAKRSKRDEERPTVH